MNRKRTVRVPHHFFKAEFFLEVLLIPVEQRLELSELSEQQQSADMNLVEMSGGISECIDRYSSTNESSIDPLGVNVVVNLARRLLAEKAVIRRFVHP